MTKYKFKVYLQRTNETEQDVGIIELASPNYGDINETDARKALEFELGYNKTTGMLSWRHTVLPREIFAGFRVELLAKWVE